MRLHTSIPHHIMTAALLMTTACSTVDHVTLTAPQSTTIFLPNDLNAPATTISNGSTAQIEIPASDYCGFIVATDPATGLRVPVGLDVKPKSYTGEKAAIGLGYTLASVGTGAIVGGTIVVIGASHNGDDDIQSDAATVVALGAGAAGLGVAIGLPAQQRLNQLSHQYQFTYVPKQTLEFGNLHSTIIHNDLPKNAPAPKPSAKRGKATTADKAPEKQSKGSSVSTNRSDKAKRISGTYIGQGKLIDSNRVEEESYSSIKVIIDRVDKNKVEVSIIESDEDFFAEKLIYNIVSSNKGVYKLTLENMPSETIVIDSKWNLKFNHSKVNISDEIYSLKITARKQ